MFDTKLKILSTFTKEKNLHSMIGDLLLKIEKLHEFIDDCVTNDSLSLIDKDIILQNLRDIYLDATKMSISDLDSDYDDFENENIVLFDSKEPLKQIETVCEESVESDEDAEMQSVENGAAEESEDFNSNDNVTVELAVENLTLEDDEDVVYVSSEESDLEMSITDDQRSLIIRELCSMNEDRYYELINKLNSFTDLDDVLIYISEEFSECQNSESAVLLADKMAERLA